MTRIVLLVRHGETEDNRAGIFQGQGGGPLNELGTAQATACGMRLSAVKFRACYSSEQPRARQTAGHILRHTEASQNEVPVREDVRLREVDVGAWQGLQKPALQLRFPDEFAAWEKGQDIRRGGGETYAEVGARFCAALEHAHHTEYEGTLLIVSHGGAIRSAVARLIGVPLDRLVGIRNTSVTALEYLGGEVGRLLLYNDLRHTDDPLAKPPSH